MANGLKIQQMVMAHIHTETEIDTKVNGKMIFRMVTVLSIGLTDLFTKEILKMDQNMAKDIISGPKIRVNFKAIGSNQQ